MTDQFMGTCIEICKIGASALMVDFGDIVCDAKPAFLPRYRKESEDIIEDALIFVDRKLADSAAIRKAVLYANERKMDVFVRAL